MALLASPPPPPRRPAAAPSTVVATALVLALAASCGSFLALKNWPPSTPNNMNLEDINMMLAPQPAASPLPPTTTTTGTRTPLQWVSMGDAPTPMAATPGGRGARKQPRRPGDAGDGAAPAAPKRGAYMGNMPAGMAAMMSPPSPADLALRRTALEQHELHDFWKRHKAVQPMEEEDDGEVLSAEQQLEWRCKQRAARRKLWREEGRQLMYDHSFLPPARVHVRGVRGVPATRPRGRRLVSVGLHVYKA